MPFPLGFPFVFPGTGSSSLEPIDHALAGIARLAQYLKGKPEFEKLLLAHLERYQDVENAYQQLNVDRRLDTAYGQQLDELGILVGQERLLASDDTYRLRIRARILLNRSSGTIPELLHIFEFLVTGAVIKIEERFPAAFNLRLYTAVSSTVAALLATFLRKGRAAGVGGTFIWQESDSDEVFTFDGTAAQALDNGKWAGAVT